MSVETDDPVTPLPDLRYIRELAKIFKQNGLGEIEIEAGGQRVLLRRVETAPASPSVAYFPSPAAAPSAPPPSPAVAVPGPSAAPVVESESRGSTAAKASVVPKDAPGDFVTSPFVGTFYRSARPGAPNFVEVGQTVSPGTTLCIVEAMKLFNEIEAEFPAVLEDVLVENGQAVEFGERLFRVRRL